MSERNGPSSPSENVAVSGFMRDLVEAPPPKSIGTLKSATEIFVKLYRSTRQEHIRVRAYYLWIEHGRPEGRALEFWDAAKAETADETSDNTEK